MIRSARQLTFAALGAALLVSSAAPASAQTWTGFHIGGSVGRALQITDTDKFVEFDTDLDGSFMDTVRTVSGADAFSPGFCLGLAEGPQPSAGCADDEDGIDFGGRAGYDWQSGAVVFGALVDVSKADITSSVTAFSTTPAFYAFTREVNYIAAFRGRVGVDLGQLLVYGTGGPAWASLDETFTSSNGVNVFVPGKGVVTGVTAWGYQAGGGVELMLVDNVGIYTEYLFTSIDDRDDAVVRSQGPTSATNPFILVNPAGTDLRRTDRLDYQTFRAGLSIRF